MIPFLQIFGWLCISAIVGFVLLWIWAEIIIKRGKKDKARKDKFDAICAEYQKTNQSVQIRAHNDKLIELHPDTRIAETPILPSNELIEDTPPMEFSDFFEWKQDGDYLVLVANALIYERFGNTVIRYANTSIIYTAEHKIFDPNELIEIIQIAGGEYLCDVVYEYPVIFDSECIVSERYIISQTHSSHAPFPVLRLSANPATIRAVKRIKEIADNERAIRIEQRSKENDAAERAEIEAKIKERHRKKQLEKQVEADLIERGEIFKEARRPPIPKDVQDVVYNRDGGKCVLCGSVENLHFDHIIPFSKGGATNIENLQILCQKCNLEKSNKIG